MVELNQIYVGSRVKIVDSWDECLPLRRQNHSGYMDRYLGMVVTVSAVGAMGGSGFQIEEDTRFQDEHGMGPITSWERNHHWYFFPEMIDYVLVDEEELSFEAMKINMSSVLGIQSQPTVLSDGRLFFCRAPVIKRGFGKKFFRMELICNE